MRSSWWACGVAVMAVALAPAPAAAAIWTRIPSNTTSAIDAVEYQGADRFWFATHDGRIYHSSGSSFVAEFSGLYDFNDIAVQPAPGNVGLAVTHTGQVFRTTGDGTWAPVSMVGTTLNHTCSGPGGPATPSGPFYDVEWATASIAYIVGRRGQVLQSTDAGMTWHEVSRQPDGTCRVPDWMSDMAIVPSAPDTIYFLTPEGRLYRTTDALATAATLVSGPTCGPRSATRKIVLDPAAPQRLWQTTWCTRFSSLRASTTAGQTFAPASWPNGATGGGLRDLAFAGGTLVGVGDSDTIVTSPDGVRAYQQPSGLGVNWRRVDLASATEAAVVGDAGAIAVTSNANSIPPPPPRAIPDTTSHVRVKRRGSMVVILVRRHFTLPPGISRVDGCRGKATLALRRKGKLVTKRATVRIQRGRGRRCPFGKLFRVKARKLGSARKLVLVIDFLGNGSVKHTHWVKKVKVPRRR